MRPLERVGIYVPGGKASYPSTVLMAAIPAKAAGVQEILMVTPPQKGGISPAVLVAADLAGVDRIYRVGGCSSRSPRSPTGRNRFPRWIKLLDQETNM